MRTLLTLLFILLVGCQPTEQAPLNGDISSKSAANTAPSSWPASTFPVTIMMGSDFDDDEREALKSATQSWNNTNGAQIEYFQTGDSSFSARNTLNEFRDGELGIYKLFTWPEEMPKTALAVTQIFGTRTSNGQIRIDHADVLLNYDYFDFTADDSWGYDLETVVLHELGHFLGLYHENTSADESVMFPTISRYRLNRAPHSHDQDNLASKYRIQSSRSIATTQNVQEVSNDSEESMVLILELHKDGKEVRRIK